MSIEITDYNPTWPEQFEVEAERIRDALGELALRIDHVGSTAVAKLAAKPVIDIQITVARLVPLDIYRLPLEDIGYTYTTTPLPFFHQPADWPHTHHVHLRQAGTDAARRTLAFRDWLRAHAGDRRAYEALKRSLASNADSETVEGRFRYSEAKTDFVRYIERRARECSSGP